jgi:hypothetical protein
VELYTILLEEYLQFALDILEVGIYYSLYSPKLTTVVQLYLNVVIMLAREDVEVNLHAFQP